jgi:hypothetical protein
MAGQELHQPLMPPADARGNKARLKLLARLVLGGASAVFVAVACVRLEGQWQSSKVALDWGWVAASVAPLLLGSFVLAIAWKLVLERMVGRRVPLSPSLLLHFESQMARYTPGKVGMPLVRMAGADKLGVPASTAGYSVLIEAISMIAAGGIVGFALLVGTLGATGNVLSAFGTLGVVALVGFTLVGIVLTLVDRRYLPPAALRLMKAEGSGPLVAWRGMLAHAAYWLTWAVHGYLAARAVGIGSAHALHGAGFYVVAPIAGILALATPSGIGVREAVLSMGLAPFVGPAPAVASAIVSRATSIGVDSLVWAFGRFALK